MIGNISTQSRPIDQRRKRRAVNCQECRRSKLRCDRQQPCGACKRRGREASCAYEIPTHQRPSPVVQASTELSNRVGSPSGLSRPIVTTSETNEARLDTHWETVLERPALEDDVDDAHDALSPLSIGRRMSLQEILDLLPPKSCCDYLVSHFFKNISAFFPILHGPTFQKQYTAFMQRPHEVDLPWLALLFSLCSLSLNTMDESDPRLACFWSQLPTSPTQAAVTVSVSRRLLRAAMTCLLQDEFFIRHKFSTFEALLMVIYNISHNGSVGQGWALLGMALNIGIALRCNIDRGLPPIETERRRRCWAGLLTLHTYQGMLFRDVDMSYLLNLTASLPADVNDSDITNEGILPPSNRHEPTQMSVMMAKIRLCQLSARICRHITGSSRLDPRMLHELDAAIAEEQKQWDSTYMIDGSPSILDSTSYAYWCVLQTYAHHLYLLLHRPFHHSKTPEFLPTSRERCIRSSMTLMSIHRQLYEAPLLRNYLWLLSGVTTLKALHAAVALRSCLLDMPPAAGLGYDLDSFQKEIESMALRMESLSGRSHICFKAHRILRQLQASSGTGNPVPGNSETEVPNTFEDWTDIREWMDADLIDWASGIFSQLT